MVTQVLNLTRSGLSDYVVQRATAVILTIYTVWVLGFFLLTPEMTYTILVGFFSSAPMQIASTLAVLVYRRSCLDWHVDNWYRLSTRSSRR